MPEDTSEWFRRRDNPLTRIFEELERMMTENIPEEIVKEHESLNGSRIREFGPYTYGYSIRIGPDGRPEIKQFGNIRPPRGPKPFQPFKPANPFPSREIPSEKDSLVDIFTKNNEVKVIAEIPATQESDIALKCTGRSLIILVNNERWKEVQLPIEVDSKNHKFTYRNGILDVTLYKLTQEEQRNNQSKIRWL